MSASSLESSSASEAPDVPARPWSFSFRELTKAERPDPKVPRYEVLLLDLALPGPERLVMSHQGGSRLEALECLARKAGLSPWLSASDKEELETEIATQIKTLLGSLYEGAKEDKL